jgi:hypothetical protein
MQTLRPQDEAPPVFHPVLDRLRLESGRLFGANDVRLLPVGYERRPFSHLLRLGVCHNGDDAPRWHCFVKVFKPKPVTDGVEQMRRRVVHDYAITRHIHQELSRFEHLDAVRPIVCFPEHLTVVTEEAEGRTLLAHLETKATWFPRPAALDDLAETMASVGRWLRALQSIDPASDHVAPGDVRDYIDLRLQRLVAGGSAVVTASTRRALLHQIERLGAAVAPDAWRSVLIHADLAPGNILVSGRRIVVLDFAMSGRGTFLHDLTRLSLQMDLLCGKPRFRPAVIARLQTALLEGFDSSLSDRHPLFRLLSLLHRVNHLATLTLQPAPFPVSVYHRRLRARHARWIAHELRKDAASGEGR